MSLVLNNINYQSFIQFSNKLFHHQNATEVFFDNSLLSYLEDCFGLCHSALTVYDATEFVDALCYNTNDLSSFYRGFYKRNPICQRIRHAFNGTTPNPTARSLVQSTSVIPAHYDESEYAGLLNKMGVHYAVVLPFGPSARFCISIFKRKTEDDFSESELNVISGIYSILANSFDAFSKVQQNKLNQEIKTAFTDNNSLGTLLLDSKLQVIDYNERAVTYLSELSGRNNLESACIELTSFLFSSKNNGDIVRKTIHNYEIVLRPYRKTDDFLFTTSYYFISINKIKESTLLGYESTINLSCLTSRQIEITKKLAMGLSYEETASELFISINTVRNHLQNIFKKLGISNQRQLIRLYLNSQYNIIN